MVPRLVVFAVVLGTGTAARAETWVAADAPAAVPMSAPHLDLFSLGAMPALGGYLAVSPNVSIGVRVRFGFLANGDPPPDMTMRDPGRGGLVAGMLAARLTAAGTWVEGAAGGGVTGSDAVPTFEVGVGHGFGVGRFTLGPTVRYLRVIGGNSSMDPGSAEIVLVGLEVTFGRHKKKLAPPPRLEVVAAVVPPPPPPEAAKPPPPPPPPADRDGDGIIDTLDRCPDEAEVVNGVDDQDGCADEGLFVVVNDRIVLDERILFDTNRARIHSKGKKVIHAIAGAWQDHTEWVHLTIEGHADIRGKASYNLWLSDVRAQRVRDALIAAGVPADAVESIGLGATRPRDLGTTDRAHARNRRVEFGIERGRRP